MGVQIEHQHAPAKSLGAHRGDRDGHVVHRAEPARHIRGRVVESAEKIERAPADLSRARAGEHLARGGDGGAADQAHRAHHLVDRNVGGVDAEYARKRVRPPQGIEQLGRMDAGQLLILGTAASTEIPPAERAALEQVPEREGRPAGLEPGSRLERAERPAVLGRIPDGEIAPVEPAAHTVFHARQHRGGYYAAPMERAILHVDMDAFYASVEQRDDPRLRGKAVAVGGASRRGVVCAASYEARPFGVRSAMPMARALRLCPQLIVVPPDFAKYSAVSDQVFEIFHSFTPEVEGLSLDEAFLDVTRSQVLLGTPRAQAEGIKARIRQRTQLTASVGIAEVKFAAKIASELSKPDGLLEVPRGQVREFLAPLPASRLWGVGPRTDEQLQRLGLRKVGDVARADPAYLEAQLGSMGPWLHDLANGIDPRAVEPDVEAKSIGAEETFDDDLEGEELLPFIHEQALRVGARLRRAGMQARSVHLKIKYADFRVVTRQETLPLPTDDSAEIFRVAVRLLGKLEAYPVRLTGVHAGDLHTGAPQLGLFDAERKKRERLNRSLDAIAEKFGTDAVLPADLVQARKK